MEKKKWDPCVTLPRGGDEGCGIGGNVGVHRDMEEHGGSIQRDMDDHGPVHGDGLEDGGTGVQNV